MTQDRNIFEWLDAVREKRAMYAQSLWDLENVIHGYYTALGIHRIGESVPQMTPGHFGVWLHEKTAWSLNRGWARAIAENTEPDVEAVFQRFFESVDQFRTLKPIVTAELASVPRASANR